MTAELNTRRSALLNRGSAADQIIADLKDQILQGVLPRGSRLPNERELAEHYQVSVPTIRESVRGLAAIKLVEPRHGAGTYVTAATDDMFASAASALIEVEQVSLLDILDILDILYVKAAALACQHMNEEELEDLVSAMNVFDRAQSRETFVVSLKTFLGRLAEASHNPLIVSLCRFLVSLLLEMAREQQGGVLANMAKASSSLQTDRRALVEALRVRDEDAARVAAIQYHQHTRTMVGGLLEAGQRAGRDSMRRAARRLRQGG